jgi:environmental stress-induced protein Ves
LVHGAGLRLDVDGREVVLDRPLQRFAFAGETPIVARLIAGSCDDLNVMTARGVVHVDAEVRSGAPGELHVRPHETLVLLVIDGELSETGGAFRLAAGDAVVGVGPGVWRFGDAAVTALVARFRRD